MLLTAFEQNNDWPEKIKNQWLFNKLDIVYCQFCDLIKTESDI
jgi:hypothetical protein